MLNRFELKHLLSRLKYAKYGPEKNNLNTSNAVVTDPYVMEILIKENLQSKLKELIENLLIYF